MINKTYNIKATSNILHLLGDELIGNDSLALFELVKNSYDADAQNVLLSFLVEDNNMHSIIIEDDGIGMTSEVIEKAWLTIGTDYKRREYKISKIHHRRTLGNKGVGRLAVHKLADKIVLETQAFGSLFGSKLVVDWNKLINSQRFVQDLSVNVEHGVTLNFKYGHGTKIILTGLKNQIWTKPIICNLVRKVTNITSPFDKIDNFDIKINSNDPSVQQWIDSVTLPDEILNNSIYFFQFKVEKSSLIDNQPANFIWFYRFRPNNITTLASNLQISHFKKNYLLVNSKDFNQTTEKKLLVNGDLNNIGTISGKFYVFNRNGRIVDNIFGAGRRRAMGQYLNENCGVRVYRDNIRVFNYGDDTDDWLDIDMNKMKRVSDHFSKKNVIGAISISMEESENGLIEKTNREGFIENEFFFKFKSIVQYAFAHFERISSQERSEVDSYLTNTTQIIKPGLADTIRDLSEKLQEKNLAGEFKPLLRKIEKDYNSMRDVMLNSGMAGLNISIIFHEVERGIRVLDEYMKGGAFDLVLMKKRIEDLSLLLQDFSPLLKQNISKLIDSNFLIKRAVEINRDRFRYHNILLDMVENLPSFKINGPGNLLLSSLSNIIDNSIYWVGVKKNLNPDSSYKPKIYINVDMKNFSGPAIVIADNGNGFDLEPDLLIQPYKTLKEGGMGLGLYYVNLVMETLGGKLLFPDTDDYDIPKDMTGALIVLVFKK